MPNFACTLTSEEVPFTNIGAGGVVAWNPKLEGIPSHVSLAHEMYHAFDSIRGLLDEQGMPRKMPSPCLPSN